MFRRVFRRSIKNLGFVFGERARARERIGIVVKDEEGDADVGGNAIFRLECESFVVAERSSSSALPIFHAMRDS